MITDLRRMDRGLYAAEATAATSFAMWGIFDTINVDDKLAQAHEMAFGNYEGSFHEHWQEIAEGSHESMTGFFSTLKGKVAELNFAEDLETGGFTNIEIAADPTQPVWDISAISSDGQEVLFQVKTGLADRAGEVQQLMADNPDVHYAVGTEIYDRIAERSSELIDQMTDIGSDYELVDGIRDGLQTLSDNMGLDLPDSIGEIVPYAGAIIMGARLIYNVIKTEKEFSTADRTTKNKMQVVQALTTMSRFRHLNCPFNCRWFWRSCRRLIYPRGWQSGRRCWRHVNRSRNGNVPEQAPPTPYAESGFEYHQAHPR